MPALLLKSYVSLILIVFVFISTFTMLEIIGRKESRFNLDMLRKIHRVNGIFFLLLYLLIAYLCLSFIFNTKLELSPRGAFHSIFAVSIIVLLIFKIAFVKYYPKFYEYAKILGIMTAIITLLTISNVENIIHQIKTPYKDMPSFSYLSDEEVKSIVAFLNTL